MGNTRAKSVIRTSAAALACAFLSVTPALADPAPAPTVQAPSLYSAMGYGAVSLASLRQSVHYDQRLSDPSGYLVARADFNGDGVADEARIVADDATQQVMVMAIIDTPERTDAHVLASLPYDQMDGLGIRVAQTSPLPSLVVFQFGEASQLNMYDGSQFVVIPTGGARSVGASQTGQ